MPYLIQIKRPLPYERLFPALLPPAFPMSSPQIQDCMYTLYSEQGIFLTVLGGKVLVASEIHPSPQGSTQQVLHFKIHLKLY